MATVALLLAGTTRAVAQGTSRTTFEISGTIINGAGIPIPGVRVTLVQSSLASKPEVITGPNGSYFFGDLPRQVATPYILEVYWGSHLIYRDFVRKGGAQTTITLR